MHDLRTASASITTGAPWRRSALRWMATFVGFPLGGLAAALLAGPLDNLPAALVGGLITGSVVGAAQSWRMGGNGPPARQWVAATALGLMVGLGVAAPSVGYGTGRAALVVQGAICGLVVGAAQAWALRTRLGTLALAWPPTVAVAWALGWAITTSAGIHVDEQFYVFGASGALVATALTAVLPVVINRTKGSAR